MDAPDGIDNWTTQLRKGILELCILSLLNQGEVYAYDLVKRLAAIRGLVVTEGTVYPLLSRLRRMGVVDTRLEESKTGPARRYYKLTPSGEHMLATMNVYWSELVRGVNGLQAEKGQRHE